MSKIGKRKPRNRKSWNQECPKTKLGLPDLDHSRSAVLDSFVRPSRSEGTDTRSMSSFSGIAPSRDCLSTRLSSPATGFTWTTSDLAAGMVNGRLAAVRRLAYEASGHRADSIELRAPRATAVRWFLPALEELPLAQPRGRPPHGSPACVYQPQEACVGIDELLCHCDPGLEFPHLDVGAGSFCSDCDSGPYMVGFRGLQFIQSSGLPPAQPARKSVEFPNPPGDLKDDSATARHYN
jgi:hypothetical protein